MGVYVNSFYFHIFFWFSITILTYIDFIHIAASNTAMMTSQIVTLRILNTNLNILVLIFH